MLKNISCLIFIVALALVCIERASADDPPGTEYPQSPINLTMEASAAPQGSYWCGPAAMQAAIRWNTGTRYEQRDIWNLMRDHTCGWLGGRDFALPGQVGDESGKIRMMNISKDFGVDPHAEAWGMKNYNPGNTYHYYIYNSLDEATRWLLWKVETYHQPVITVVGAGNHNVDVVAHKSERSALDVNGPGTIYRVYYFDSLTNPGIRQSKDYKWGQWNWDDYFKAYSDNNGWDPEPTTGWYITPPSHWHGGWVTVERDDMSSSNPDQALSRIDGQVSFLFHRPLTYLPKVQGNYNNKWNSTITIRNNTGSTVNVSITFYDAPGMPTGTLASTAIGGNGSLSVNVSNLVNNFSGAAVVAASGDVAVSVSRQRSPSPYSSGAYSGIPTAKTSSTFYVPLVMNRLTTASGEGNGRVTVQNVGSSSTTVTTQFFNGSGSPTFSRQMNLAPNGNDNYDLTDLPSQWYGSAVISAGGGGRIAVVSELRTGSDGLQTLNAFPAESVWTTWLAPLFTSRLSNGLSTPVTFQNLSGAQIPINGLTLYCTPDLGCAGCSALTVRNSTAIPNNTSYFFNPVVDTTNFPAGWYGSCRLTSSGNGVSFVQMRYVGTSTANTAAYEAVKSNGTALSLSFPRVAERLPDGFATAVTIQNLSDAGQAHVTLRYWGSTECPGSANVGPLAYTIAAGSSLIRNHRLAGTDGLPDGWCGSLAVTSSDQKIDGFIQLTNINNPPGDTFMAHDAITQP